MNIINQIENNEKLFFKIFKNKVIRSTIFYHLRIYNLFYFNNYKERITFTQIQEYQLKDKLLNSYYSQITIILKNEQQLFQLLKEYRIPNSVKKLTFIFNNIRTEFNLSIIGKINNDDDVKSEKSNAKFSIFPESSLEKINFLIATMNNSKPSLMIIKNIVCSIIDESILKSINLQSQISLPLYKLVKQSTSSSSKKSISSNSSSSSTSQFDNNNNINNNNSIYLDKYFKLESLSIGGWFKDEINSGWLPINGLQRLTFKNEFDNIIKIGSLYEGLKEINFGEKFNTKILPNVLPNTIEILTFGHFFCQSLKDSNILPSSLQCLKFSRNSNFNGELNIKNLNNLKILELGIGYFQILIDSNLPISLERITVYHLKNIKKLKSNHLINLNTLKIKSLEFNRNDCILNYSTFNNNTNFFPQNHHNRDEKQLIIKSLPSNIKKLRIDGDFQINLEILKNIEHLSIYPIKPLNELGFQRNKNQNYSIKKLKLFLNSFQVLDDQLLCLNNLNHLEIRGRFNQSLDNVQLPNNLLSLEIRSTFNHALSDISFKNNPNIQLLRLSSYFQKKLEPNHLPKNLKYFIIDGYPYHHLINKDNLTADLKGLTIQLSQQSQLESLPNLQFLDLSYRYYKLDLMKLNLPNSITILSFSLAFDITLSSKWLPNSIKNIILKNICFNYEGELPDSLQSIYISCPISHQLLLDSYITKFIKTFKNPDNLLSNLLKLQNNYLKDF